MNRDLFRIRIHRLGLLPVSVLGRPGARNDQPGGMGYRTSGKHALNGPPTARHDRGACPMPASRHASAAGKRAETMAAVMALSVLIAAAQSALAQQAPEGAPAAWRVECVGDGKTLDCRAVQQVFHRETRQLVVSALVRPAADGKTGAMVITLPLGLNLTVQDANKKPIEMSLPLLGFGIAFDKAK